jgi:hypothetical protein
LLKPGFFIQPNRPGKKVDRKAIKRNLMNLLDFGYEIEYSETVHTNKNGEEETIYSDWYLKREFIDARTRAFFFVSDFILTPHSDNGKTILTLAVQSGRNTPYYYAADGIKQAYIRLGNESVPAPDYILNELILKGTNRTYDALVTDYKQDDYSFTLLMATYRERTRVRFEDTDFVSYRKRLTCALL